MKTKALLAATCGLTILLAGTASAENSNAVSDGFVKIGILTDLSGPYEDLTGQGSITAAQMAIDDFGGEVLGKPIKLVSADHQQKPDHSSATARRWIDQDGVDMITGLGQSALGLAVQKVASGKHVITMNTGAGTTELTGSQCTPYGIHYSWDTHAVSVGTATAVVQTGGKKWFFIAADYAFGKSLEKQSTNVVERLGGSVAGSVRAPLGTNDFSSYLLQAKASGAQVIGLANAGSDTVNAIKQANEFGIVQGGQQLAALVMFVNDVKSLGLKTSQGLQFTTAFYWDRNQKSRDFSKRFFEKRHTMPNMDQVGTYSAVTSYLKAVQAAGTDNSDAVRAALGKMEIDDVFGKGHIRPDGLFEHDMFLVEVKKPSESKGDWDLLKVKKRIPGDQAFMSIKEGGCPLVGS